MSLTTEQMLLLYLLIRRRRRRRMNFRHEESLSKRKKGKGRPKTETVTLETERVQQRNYVTCCALACTNTSESQVLIRLPSNPERRQQWLARINRPAFVFSPISALCQVHFDTDAWEEDALGARVLKPDVLPTLYLNGEVNNSANTLVRNNIDDDNNETMGSSIFIKQEALEPDIEMMEETSGVKKPFEAVYLNSNIDKQNEEDFIKNTNIKVEHLDVNKVETGMPEDFPANIKTESLDIVDVLDQTVTASCCPECGETFQELWDLEHHLIEKHSESESAKILKQEKSAYNVKNVSNPPQTTGLTSSGPSSSSTVTQTKGQGEGTSKKYLILVPQSSVKKQSLAEPSSSVTHPPAFSTSPIDSSESFTISLAHFPESKRVGIKKKMLEVVETVDRLKVDAEMIVIAYRPPNL